MTIRKKTPSFEKLRGSLECGQNTSQQSLARKAHDNPTSSHRYMNACKGLFPFGSFLWVWKEVKEFVGGGRGGRLL
jgi:hypothetical protein